MLKEHLVQIKAIMKSTNMFSLASTFYSWYFFCLGVLSRPSDHLPMRMQPPRPWWKAFRNGVLGRKVVENTVLISTSPLSFNDIQYMYCMKKKKVLSYYMYVFIYIYICIYTIIYTSSYTSQVCSYLWEKPVDLSMATIRGQYGGTIGTAKFTGQSQQHPPRWGHQKVLDFHLRDSKQRRPQTCVVPIGSMYGIYANIWGILMLNVTIYSIHGSYGVLDSRKCTSATRSQSGTVVLLQNKLDVPWRIQNGRHGWCMNKSNYHYHY